jgi:D-serine deaminase-like pyridoxal phosphate-dependent protein
VKPDDLRTPALLVDKAAFEHNVATMSSRLPGPALRPHVKAFKSTSLARELVSAGHETFCCATLREVEGMADAGMGTDLLLANQTVDVDRLGELSARDDLRLTVAVDSDATIAAAATGGVREVLIDVNVGLPRCGCAPGDAGRLADLARAAHIGVRGVMGYEGHLQALTDRAKQAALVERSMAKLLEAHDAVGGDVISGGGTGTHDLNTWVNEIQAGSYVLMDTQYNRLGMPFQQGLFVLATVISTTSGDDGWYVVDAGLKALAMDHGDPDMADPAHQVLFCSDEHTTVRPGEAAMPAVGDKVRMVPAHIDPTIAKHEVMHVVDDDLVHDTWPVDLRGW